MTLPAAAVLLRPALRGSVRPAVYGQLRTWVKAWSRQLKFMDKVQFDDRRTGSRVLVSILAGYKQELWPFTIPRLCQALPDCDVCVVSPGIYSEELARLCRDHGWSYISTKTNDVGLAQNICFNLHQRAELIVKVDEDMFLLRNSIDNLIGAYRATKAAGIVDPGFIAPLIPINGFCYRYILEELGCLGEFERRFGRARLAVSGIPIQRDPAAAQWMWELTAPLEETFEKLSAGPPRTLPCSIQFSIGLIVFERAFWELFNYFPVERRRLLAGMSTLGSDEAHICRSALALSRPGVVTTAAFAGHFCFGPQYSAMRSLIQSRPDLFAI